MNRTAPIVVAPSPAAVVVLGPGVGRSLIRRFVRAGGVRAEVEPLYVPPRPAPQFPERAALREARRHGYGAVLVGAKVVTPG